MKYDEAMELARAPLSAHEYAMLALSVWRKFEDVEAMRAYGRACFIAGESLAASLAFDSARTLHQEARALLGSLNRASL